jgi:hypothetical protein
MQIYVQGNQLWGSFLSGGTGGTLGPNGYDAVNERFLRIRVVGSTYFFEAGPSLTSFPVTIGSEGGSVVDPSPSSIELGVSVSAAGVAATSADFGMAILLGPYNAAPAVTLPPGYASVAPPFWSHDSANDW